MQIAHLTERRQHDLSNAVLFLERAIAIGIVPNKVFTGAKETINRACHEGTEKFLNTVGPASAERPHLTDNWMKAYQNDAFVSGATNVPTALKRARKVGMTEYVAYLETLQPLCDLLTAAKPLIKKRGELPVERTPAQIADDAKRMTCQCCARRILAETGTIAHHGYERPDHGYQTASCMGAKELPFEADRRVLGKVITFLMNRRDDMKVARGAVAAEQRPIRRSWSTGRWNDRTEHTFDFTRANFRTAEATAAKSHIGIHGDFDTVLKAELAARDYAIRNIEQEIVAQKARYDGWKQTHKRVGGEWKEV